MSITETVAAARAYFESGATRPLAFRKQALCTLRDAIRANEPALTEALRLDLNKPASESYLTEIGILYDEIRYHLKHLKGWMKNRRVRTPTAQFPGRSYRAPEPYGVALILAPWNYPVQLCLAPLIGAISAGNCAVVKPSAYAPHVSRVLAEILAGFFPAAYISVVEGGREENQALLAERFDYIFFTGSPAVGRTVMQAASAHLTPVSLELGGKSPVIVEESADLRIAARRIAFGKVLNAGQTCVAPDYLLIPEKCKEYFTECYREALISFFPNGDLSDFPRIVNEKHYRRLLSLLEGQTPLYGGGYDERTLTIEPTLLDAVDPASPIMQEEIFGPILPILTYQKLEDAIAFVRARPKPLALYLFTKSREVERLVWGACSFGGGCINDTVVHLATTHMPFGGVGESGMGAYHGRASFDTFTHYRSTLRRGFFPDLKLRYRPYSRRRDAWIRRFMK